MFLDFMSQTVLGKRARPFSFKHKSQTVPMIMKQTNKKLKALKK